MSRALSSAMEYTKPMDNIDTLIEKVYNKNKREMVGYADAVIEEKTSKDVIEALQKSTHLNFQVR